jgi:hypothetical protein
MPLVSTHALPIDVSPITAGSKVAVVAAMAAAVAVEIIRPNTKVFSIVNTPVFFAFAQDALALTGQRFEGPVVTKILYSWTKTGAQKSPHYWGFFRSLAGFDREGERACRGWQLRGCGGRWRRYWCCRSGCWRLGRWRCRRFSWWCCGNWRYRHNRI